MFFPPNLATESGSSSSMSAKMPRGQGQQAQLPVHRIRAALCLALRALLILCAGLIPVGCSFASNVADTQKQAEAMTLALEKELGAKPFVGWNITNGVLTSDTVSFESGKVANLTVADLESRTRRAVLDGFKHQPTQLAVMLTSAP